MVHTYLKMILLLAPCFLMNDILICFVRNDGNPGLSMAATLTGSMSNILLDYVFIFPMNLGIFGAVFATGLAPVISMCVLSFHFIRRKNGFALRRGKMSPAWVRQILSLGVPSLVAEAASGIVMVVFNFIILGLAGNIGVAAYGVIANLSLVVVSIYTGIAQGMQPLVSRAYGQNEKTEVRQLLRYALVTMTVASCVIYLLICLFADPVAAVFNSGGDAGLQTIAVTGLRLYFTAVPFMGFNIIISVYFTSTERAFPAQIVSLSRGFLVIVPLAFLLSFLAGMTGVWLAFPAAEGLVSVFGVICYFRRRMPSGKKC